MAVKQSYGVKTPMLSTALDTEITLQKDGVGLRPLPIKFVIITIVSACICLKLTTSDFISTGTTFQRCLFVVLWLTMTILLFMSDKTKRMNFEQIISLINYISVPSNRRVITRRDSPATSMLDMCNIKTIDKQGLIKFADHNVGYMYRVTGTASVLLFDTDKQNIINTVDNFYRKVDSNTEYIYITLKEPQKIHNQAVAIKHRYNRLSVYDSDLNDLCNNQLVMLKDVVGKKYQSIHQYMIIKSDSLESLNAAKITLQNELGTSGLFIKRCIPLYAEDILDVFAAIYAAPKYDDNIEVMMRKDAIKAMKTGGDTNNGNNENSDDREQKGA